MPAPLARLLDAVASARAVQDGFDFYQKQCFTERPPEFFALELNGEAGELANLEKKAWKGKPVDEARFRDEAADVYISLMNYCNARGVDIAAAVEAKLREIERRRREGLM
jgi:NTP pyrophosphatase (non-canonical NTP hydrolase)